MHQSTWDLHHSIGIDNPLHCAQFKKNRRSQSWENRQSSFSWHTDIQTKRPEWSYLHHSIDINVPFHCAKFKKNHRSQSWANWQSWFSWHTYRHTDRHTDESDLIGPSLTGVQNGSGPDRARPHLGPGPDLIWAWGRITFDELWIMCVVLAYWHPYTYKVGAYLLCRWSHSSIQEPICNQQ